MFLLLSAYKNKPNAFTNTHFCFQKFDKSFFSLSHLAEGMGLFFEPAVSENRREIVLSAAATKGRVITNSNGCFYINGSLWRPSNEQIARVEQLWKRLLRRRKQAGKASGGFLILEMSAGQRWASVCLIVFWGSRSASEWTASMPGRRNCCEKNKKEAAETQMNRRLRSRKQSARGMKTKMLKKMRKGEKGDEKSQKKSWKSQRSREQEAGKTAKERINKHRRRERGRRKCCSSAKQRESSSFELGPH